MGLALLALAGPILAGPPAVLSNADRAAAVNRPVAVSLVPGIASSVDIGRVVSDTTYGGGLIGALILASTDNKRQLLASRADERARSAITPLTAALAGADYRELALSTSRRALGKVAGFDPAGIALVPGPEISSSAALIAEHPSSQMGKVVYRLEMSPDFTQLRLIADLAIEHAGGINPAFAQRIVSVVRLRQRSYVHEENVSRWSQNDGRVVKQAIAAAFTRAEAAVSAVMTLTPERYAILMENKKTNSAFAAGFYGPTLLSDELGSVIWSKGNGFIAVQAAAD